MTDAQHADITIDVVGMSMSLPAVAVSTRKGHINFIADAKLKHGVAFHYGAFFSKAVLTKDIFTYPKGNRIAVLMESPIDACYQDVDQLAQRFPIILTHQRQLIARGFPFLELMFGTNWLGVRDAQATSIVSGDHPEKSRMVSFMGSLDHPSNGAYRFRREVAEYVLQRGDVDCFGKGIKPVAGKREAIAPYRFSIAMENASSDYYFSEKLVDCLLLETVPIYYGCPGIGDLFDSRGMLVFASIEELTEILGTLTTERYEQMRPFILANKEKAIRERWHNHQALFERLGEILPPLSSRSPICRTGLATRSRRLIRRLFAG